MSLSLEAFVRFEPLLAASDGMAPGTAGFFDTPVWWRSVVEAGMAEGDMPCFLLCRDGSRPVAMLALRRGDAGRRLESLTNPYTCLYAPRLASGLDAAMLRAIGRCLAGFCKAWPVVRLDAMAEDTPGMEGVLAGMREGGLLARRFNHFGNWHAAVAGLDWAAYLASRRGALRETIRRRMRRAERDGIRFEIVREGAGLEAGIAAYESVYARSWKTAEPFPQFNPVMMRHAAEAGMLRLGLLHAPAEGGGAIPIAAPALGGGAGPGQRAEAGA